MFTDVLNISHINGIIRHRVFFNCRGSSISSISKCIFVFRVGAKNSGTRFLSFVDTMLGYRHLLTAEDLNKAASMCSSLKGVLRSRFLVLSDDKDPPPPPARGKRSHPDGDNTTTAGGKRFQTRAQAPQVQTTVEAQINAEPRPSLHRQPAPAQVSIQPVQTVNTAHGQVSSAPRQIPQPVQDEVHILTVDHHNTSTPYEVVKNRRGRRLPAGVKPIARPVQTTPDRQAKTSRIPAAQSMPDPDAIDLDVEIEVSPSGSADMDADGSGGSSTGTVVDWVST